MNNLKATITDEKGNIVGISVDLKWFLKQGASHSITHAVIGSYPTFDTTLNQNSDDYELQVIEVDRIFFEVPLDRLDKPVKTGQTGQN